MGEGGLKTTHSYYVTACKSKVQGTSSLSGSKSKCQQSWIPFCRHQGRMHFQAVQAVGRIRLHELLGLRSSFSCCVSTGLPLALGLAHGPLHLKTSNQALFTLPPHVCLFSCLSSYLPSVLSFSYICTVEFPSGCHDTVLFQ